MADADAKNTKRQATVLIDAYLVIAAKNGDRAAAESLAHRWRPRLLRTARRLLGDAALAEDVVQEAWISIARGIGRLIDPDRFPAFAFKILHRRCVDAIRKRSKERDQSASASHGDHQSTDSQPEGSVDDRPQMHHRMAISEAFAALPNDQRLTAILFFAEGMTLKEISEATDVPIGTVKSRVFHARQKLKALLEGEKDDHII